MRLLAAMAVVTVMAGSVFAQRTSAPANDPGKGTYVSASSVAADVAKLPNQPMGSVPILKVGPYNINVEHRRTGPAQAASMHEKDAELFQILDGSATLVTGGTLVDGVKNGENWRGSAIQGGTAQKMTKGDFMLVPPGVNHWFTDIQGTVTELSVHLPMQ